MDQNGEARNDHRCAAVRELLMELARVRRIVASFPGEQRLRRACIADLQAALAKVGPSWPLVLELAGQEVCVSGTLVHREPLERPFWRLLTTAGATGLLLAPPIKAEALVRFAEVLLESSDGDAGSDPIARLRAAEPLGIEALFGRGLAGAIASPGRGRATPSTSLGGGPTRALLAADQKRLRAALEQELVMSRPLLATAALASALASDPPAAAPVAVTALLERLLEMQLAAHDLRSATAVLEEADRCILAEGGATARLEAAILRAAADHGWLEKALLAAKREDLQALGVLVLRIDGLLATLLRNVELAQEPRLVRELELFARLDPSAFASCAESHEPRVRASSRELLARAGHRTS